MIKAYAKLNLNKINKNKITQRAYKDKTGQEHIVKELEIEIVPLKTPEKIHEGTERNLWKVGFITEKSVKNEVGEWINGNTLGDVTEWRDKKFDIVENTESFKYPTEDIDESSIPF